MADPIANPVIGGGNEDTLIEITLVGSDLDGGPLAFILQSLPVNGLLYRDQDATVLASTGMFLNDEPPGSHSLTLYFKPAANWNGETTFSYIANDGNADSAPATATLTVDAVNDAPALSPGGTLDGTFGGDGVVTTHFKDPFGGPSGDGAHAVAIQPDGKIVAAGVVASFDGVEVGLARYNPDGTLDTSFGGGDGLVIENEVFGLMSNGADALALQPDGKFFVAGPDGGTDFAVFRYNADGSRDVDFGNGSIGTGIGLGNEAHAVMVLPDGDIVIAGTTGVFDVPEIRLTRLNSDGTAHWPGSVFTAFEDGVRCFGAALQDDGKIVVVGSALLSEFPDLDFVVLRYNADGSLDSTFGGGDGIVTTDFEGFDDIAYGVAIQEDGKIVVAGSAQTLADGDLFALARYDSNGNLDSSFSGDGLATAMFGVFGNDFGRSVALQADGKIVVGGYGTDSSGIYDFAFARFETDGDLDPGFGSGGLATVDVLGSDDTDTAYAVAIQADGGIVLAGDTRVGGDPTDFALVRVLGGGGLPDQRVDEDAPYSLSFSPNLFSDAEGDAITYGAVLADDSLLPAWLTFTSGTRTFSGTPDADDVGTLQVKITASDGMDTGFDVFTLVVNGGPTLENEIPNQMASEDSPFNFVFAADTFADPNGDTLSYTAVLAGGGGLPDWLTFDGATRAFTGTPLNENVGTLQVEVTASDGSLNASDTFDLTILNTDDAPILTPAGTLDTGFGGDGTVVVDLGEEFAQSADIFLLPDGRIVVGGQNGNGAFAARFDDDGNPDATFSGDGFALLPGTHVGSDMAGYADGKVLLAGGDDDITLVRLNADGTLDVTFGGDGIVTTDLLPLFFPDEPEFDSFESAHAVAIQADGKIVILGTVEANFAPGSGTFLARYNPDGSLDTGFGNDGAIVFGLDFLDIFSFAGDLAISQDGTIVSVGGRFDGIQQYWWVNAQNGGEIQQNLFSGPDFGQATSVAVQEDGKILVLGSDASGGTTLIRLTSNLQLDASFGVDGIVTDPALGTGDVFVDGAGRIIVSGSAGGNAELARFNSDGTLDESFSGDGVVTFQPEGVAASSISAIAMDDVGRIVVTGVADSDVLVARIMGDLLGDQVVNAGTAFNLTLPPNTFTDPDGDTITGYTATLADDSPLPDWLTFNTGTRAFSGIPDLDDVGAYDVKVSASEGNLTGSHVFELTVNGAPTVANEIPDQGTFEDELFEFQVPANTFADPNAGEILTYSAAQADDSALPFWLTFDAATRTFTGTPVNGDVDVIEIKVTASDGLLSVFDVFEVEVVNTNDDPFLVTPIQFQAPANGVFAAGIGDAFSFTFDENTFFDEDAGEILTYTATLANDDPLPAWLTLTSATRTFSGEAGEADSGQIEIKVTATDTGLATATDTFFLTVTHAPELVTPVADQGATEDTPFLFTFGAGTFADDDGETLTYYATLIEDIEGGPTFNILPGWLQFDAETRTFSGTPENDDVGLIDITLWATDGFLFASDTFTLDVENVNDAPQVGAGGQLDDSFGTGGLLLHDLDSGNDIAFSVAIQPDSKLVVVGERSDESGSQAFVARYTPGGNLDSTFGPGGGRVLDLEEGDDTATDVALQEDGKIVIAASSQSGQFEVLRLNEDGSSDTAFSGDGRASASFADPATARDVAVLADGKILVAGDAGGTAALARFNADGTLDTGFSGDGKAAPAFGGGGLTINSMAVQSDGKIVLAGGDGSAVIVARLNADGTLDTSFGGGDGWTSREFSGEPDSAHGIAIQPDGAIVVAVTASDFNNPLELDGFVLRLLGDGSEDTTFGNGFGVASVAPNFALSGAFSVALAAGGSIVVTGAVVGGGLLVDALVTRLNPDGSLDSSFGTNGQQGFGSGEVNIGFDVAIQADGRIVVVGANGDLELADPTAPIQNGQLLLARLLPGAPQLTTALEDSPFELEFPDGAFVDVDVDDVLTYSAAALEGELPAWLSFDPETRTFSGTPENGDVGGTLVEVTATDLAGEFASHVFTLSVQNVNDAPLVANALPDRNVNEGNAFIMNLPLTTFTDVDVGDTFTFDIALAGGDPLPDWLLYLPASRTLLGTPSQADVGTYQIEVTADDGEASVVDTFSVVVTNVNVAPFLAHPLALQSATEDELFSFQFAADAFSDPDGDSLSYAAGLAGGGELPEWLTLDPATRTFSGTPADADVGTLEVRLSASDGSLTASDLFTIEVANVNDLPVLAIDIEDQAAVAGNLFDFTLDAGTFADDDGDVLVYTATLADDSPLPAWLEFDGPSRTFTGTPGLEDIGIIEVKVAAADPSDSATDIFRIAVDTNLITGTPDNDVLPGTPANDAIDGGAGGDIMTGGTGNDTYYVDSTGDVVIELPAGGTDTVVSTISYELGSDVENLTLGGTGAISGAGNDGANVLTGNAASNVLVGGLGNDIYIVTGGVDQFVERAGGGIDTVHSGVSWVLGAALENLVLTGTASVNGTGNTSANTITGNTGNNLLSGSNGNDTLLGGGGGDTLVGGAGNDLMAGGAGNDLYSYATGDTIVEDAGEGVDTVMTGVSLSLAVAGREHFENVTLTGSAAINATGNALDNMLTGNAGRNALTGGAGNDTLTGGAGIDTLRGGAGNDTYMYGTGDVISELAGEGIDLVLSGASLTLAANVDNLSLTGLSAVNGTGNALANVIEGNSAANSLSGAAGNDSLTGGGGNDMLNGGADNDVLNGNSGNDVLNGSTGADAMAGGEGNDTYVVDNAADTVSENAASGTDLVQSTITWTLGANTENLTLVGGTIINGTGNELANVLIGNAAINQLSGGEGNDTLNGGAGIDTLMGGLGSDTYVYGVGDLIVEFDDPGIDLVQSSVTVTLAANVENLQLTGSTAISGTGNELANLITGNAGANQLNGGAGNDTLNGGAGNDVLRGGLGDDVYVFGTGDNIVELEGGGTDLVQSGISHALAANVENLTLTGTAAINGTGNVLDNVLNGNNGNNVLSGMAGSDLLDGGAGADSLLGGEGNDVLVHGEGDRRVDGGNGEDTLRLAGSGQVLDLTTELNTVHTGIEIVDLTGTGDNSLTVHLSDLLDLSDATNTLRVDGNAGDTVTSTGQGWTPGGTVEVFPSVFYQSYTAGAATLLLAPDIVAGSTIT